LPIPQSHANVATNQNIRDRRQYLRPCATRRVPRTIAQHDAQPPRVKLAWYDGRCARRGVAHGRNVVRFARHSERRKDAGDLRRDERVSQVVLGWNLDGTAMVGNRNDQSRLIFERDKL